MAVQVKSTKGPLFGFPWNQAEVDPNFNHGLLTLIAFDKEERPHPIGTGFVISRDDRKAVCLTAAHVITELRNLQAPPSRHAMSALPEFLPPPREIDLSRQMVRAIALERDRAEVLVVEGAIVDENRDIAVITVALQDEQSGPFFSQEFEADDSIPPNGNLVCILSYGDLSADNFITDGDRYREFWMSRRPILRIGTVVEHHPNGHRLCRGPCIETTVPVYSGMSGGPAFAFGRPGQPMRPIGLVCSDPDIDGPEKEDRTKSGSSIVTILPCSVEVNSSGVRSVRFEFQNAESAGEILTMTRAASDDR